MPEDDKTVQLRAELNYLKWVLSVISNPETRPILKGYDKDILENKIASLEKSLKKNISSLEHALEEESK